MTKSDFRWILLTALAIVFSIFSLPLGINGGSLSLDILILFVILFSYDLKYFMSSVFLYLIISALLGGTYYFSLIQWILDYPLALLVLGSGKIFIKNKNLISESLVMFIGLVLKLLVHIISGILFFSTNIPNGQNPIIYSVTYNLSYMLPEIILTMILYIILKKSNVLNFS